MDAFSKGNEMNELVPISNADPVALFSPGGLESILAAIETQARALVADVATTKGRKAIASNANNVAKAKTYLDGLGKEYVADLKKVSNAVDAERRAMRDRLDRLKDDVRAPLTEWEQAEQARVDRHKSEIEKLERYPHPDATADEVMAIKKALESVVIDESWEEYQDLAAATRKHMIDQLDLIFIARRDKEELARLRAQQEEERIERERKEREDRIARESAERARIEAEQKAEKEIREAREAEARARFEKEQAEARLEAEARNNSRHTAADKESCAAAVRNGSAYLLASGDVMTGASEALEDLASIVGQQLASEVLSAIRSGFVRHVTFGVEVSR